MPDCLARSSSGGNAGSSRESKEEWSKWLPGGGGEISHQIRQVFQSTHFFVSRHWPHLAQSFVSPECLTDVVAVHPLLCQCQCHAPGVEMCLDNPMPALPRTMAFVTTCCTKRSGVSGPKIFAKSSIRICTKAETWKIVMLCFCFLKSGNLFAVVLVHHVSLV